MAITWLRPSLMVPSRQVAFGLGRLYRFDVVIDGSFRDAGTFRMTSDEARNHAVNLWIQHAGVGRSVVVFYTDVALGDRQRIG